MGSRELRQLMADNEIRELRQLMADNEIWRSRPQNQGQPIFLHRLRSSERNQIRLSTNDGQEDEMDFLTSRRQARTPPRPRGQNERRARSRSPLRSIPAELSTTSGENSRDEVHHASGSAVSTRDFEFLRPSSIPPRCRPRQFTAQNRSYILANRVFNLFIQLQGISEMASPMPQAMPQVQAPAPPAENIERRTLQIKNFPTREVTSQDETQSCVICMTEYDIGEQLTELPCNHRFHQNCINTWLVSNPHCPLCRHNCFQ